MTETIYKICPICGERIVKNDIYEAKSCRCGWLWEIQGEDITDFTKRSLRRIDAKIPCIKEEGSRCGPTFFRPPCRACITAEIAEERERRRE